MKLSAKSVEIIDDAMAEVLRRKTPQQRLAIAFGMWSSARRQLSHYLRSIHPEWDDTMIQKETAKRLSHEADVVIAKENAFDRSRFQRLKRITPIEETWANFASPEDVIIMKMVYYKEGESEKHLRDIASMLKISGDEIDRNYIESRAGKLDLLQIWNVILAGPKK